MNSSQHHAFYLALPPTIKSLVDASPKFRGTLQRLRLSNELESGVDIATLTKTMLLPEFRHATSDVLACVRGGLRCKTSDNKHRLAAGAPAWATADAVVDGTDEVLLSVLLGRPEVRPHLISRFLVREQWTLHVEKDIVAFSTVRDRMEKALSHRIPGLFVCPIPFPGQTAVPVANRPPGSDCATALGTKLGHAAVIVQTVLIGRPPNPKREFKRIGWNNHPLFDSHACDAELAASATSKAVAKVAKSRGTKMMALLSMQATNQIGAAQYRVLLKLLPDLAREVGDVAQVVAFVRPARRGNPAAILPTVRYADEDFAALYEAFRSVLGSVVAAAANANAADTPAAPHERRVKAARELTLRFRKAQDVDLGGDAGGAPNIVHVPMCTLTFGTVEGLVVTDQDGARILSVSADGVAKTCPTAEDAAPFVGLLAALQTGNFQNVATRISALTRECVFCSHPLTDADSIKRGAGDHCMKKYGRAYDVAVLAARLSVAALPAAAAQHVENVRVREVIARLDDGRRLPPHVMWLVTAADVRGRSDLLEGLCECIGVWNDVGDDEALDEALMGHVARLTGAVDAGRACRDLERVRSSRGAWLPAVIGLSAEGFVARLLDACRVAEHLGDERTIVSWIADAGFCLGHVEAVARELAPVAVAAAAAPV